MFLFKKKHDKFPQQSREFDKRLAAVNRRIDNLDFKISEYRRKFLNLQMRGRRFQSVAELERMLREMQMEAADIQMEFALLKKGHAQCVTLVQGLVDEFESVVSDLPAE